MSKGEENGNGNGTRASSNRNEVSIAVVREQMEGIKNAMTNIREEQKEVRRDIKDLSEKIDDKYVTRVEHSEIQKDVDSLKSNVTWIVRLVIGAVLIAVISGGFIVSKNM